MASTQTAKCSLKKTNEIVDKINEVLDSKVRPDRSPYFDTKFEST